MKMDDFEKELKRQPLRPIPPDWKRRILLSADREDNSDQKQIRAGWSVSIRELLWPAPAAWSALAAIWIVIAGLRMASMDSEKPGAPAQADYAQLRAAMELKRAIEAETQVAQRPPAPEPTKPRSHLRQNSVTV